MKSHWIAGLTALSVLPSMAMAETVYSSTVMQDATTGETSIIESKTDYQTSPAALYVPSAPVERQAYAPGAPRNLARETPGYDESLNLLAPAARMGETNPANIGVNDDVLTERRTGDIAYITGGVGHAERGALDGMRSKYNFRLTNTESGGAFVSYTNLTVTDAKGGTVLVADSDPIFFAKLPNGKYTLSAEHEGQIKKQSFQIQSGKPVSLQLHWM